MPKLTSNHIKETPFNYKARKISKYAKKYNLDKIQVQELIDNNEIEFDSEILGYLTVIIYNEETLKFTIKEIPKPLNSDYMGDSEFESEDSE